MRFFIITLMTITFALAKCNMNVNVDGDLKNNSLHVKVFLRDNTRSVEVDFSHLPLNNPDIIKNEIKNGSNELSFEYTIKDKETINKNFIMLLNSWLPYTKTLCTYDVKVKLPKDMTVIVEADEVSVNEHNADKIWQFKIDKPIDSLSLISGNNYDVRSIEVDGIEVVTYLFEKHAYLSSAYFKKMIELIKEYQEKLGPYPYKRFAIVENRFQTGYSMPTFTLIGDRIISKPYLIERSLGHEFTHQWMGNGLFSKQNGGNWTEGITTWLSDFQVETKKGNETRYRHNALQTYMLESNDGKTLEDFRFRYDNATKTLGYDKGFFLWEMLSQKLGKEKFLNILRQFVISKMHTKIGYEDIVEFFVTNVNELDKTWFDQWIKRDGMASFDISLGEVKIIGGKYKLPINIIQDTKEAYDLDIPLHVKSDRGDIIKTISINEHNNSLELEFDEAIYQVDIDPNKTIFRTLFANEALPTLSSLKNSQSLIVVGKNVPSFLKNAKLVAVGDLTMDMLMENDIVFTQDSLSLAKKFMGIKPLKGYDWSLHVQINPWASAKVVAVVLGEIRSRSLMYRLKYYGSYSQLGFYKNSMLLKEKPKLLTYEMKFDDIQTVIEPPKSQSFTDLMAKISNHKVVMIGETHTNRIHHQNQLRIIKSMYKDNKEMAIALEMFQRPFQKYLDMYIENKIDLFEMLEKTEYYKRWKYDMYNYVDIFEWAREHSVKLIATNQDKKISNKITKNGIGSLDEKERKKLPDFIDFSNDNYKHRLSKFFSHAHGERKFDTTRLYQSQIVWDETMAQSISQYLKNNPNKKIAFLVGSGHLRYFDGIPNRLEREIGEKVFVIIQGNEIAPKIADMVILTSQIEGKKSPKLGVYLNYDTMKIDKIIEGKKAEQIGLKKGDVIVEMNGKSVENISDLKLLLFKSSYLNEDIVLKVKREKKIIELR